MERGASMEVMRPPRAAVPDPRCAADSPKKGLKRLRLQGRCLIGSGRVAGKLRLPPHAPGGLQGPGAKPLQCRLPNAGPAAGPQTQDLQGGRAGDVTERDT